MRGTTKPAFELDRSDRARWLFVLVAAFVTACASRGLRPGPATGSWPAEALEELRSTLIAHVESREGYGLVAVVSHSGRTRFFECIEDREVDGNQTRGGFFAKESIFRIGALTVPVLAVATLTFVEEGRIALDDPLSKYLPELASPRVRTLDDTGTALADTRPAAREILVADLLAQTSGLPRSPSPGGMVEHLYTDWQRSEERAETARDVARKLAELPLGFDPGTAWAHGYSPDVLGAVLEAIDGRTLQEILEERVLGPLGMGDTAFFVPPEKKARLAPHVVATTLGSTDRVFIAIPWYPGEPSDRPGPPAFCSGTHGLYSTASDCLRFCEMLAGRGERDGVRILTEESFEAMTTDRIAGLPRIAHPYVTDLDADSGYGLGVAVRVAKGGEMGHGAIGTLHGSSWSPGWCCFTVDPGNRLIGILLGRGVPPGTVEAFRDAVQDALSSVDGGPER